MYDGLDEEATAFSMLQCYALEACPHAAMEKPRKLSASLVDFDVEDDLA